MSFTSLFISFDQFLLQYYDMTKIWGDLVTAQNLFELFKQNLTLFSRQLTSLLDHNYVNWFKVYNRNLNKDKEIETFLKVRYYLIYICNKQYCEWRTNCVFFSSSTQTSFRTGPTPHTYDGRVFRVFLHAPVLFFINMSMRRLHGNLAPRTLIWFCALEQTTGWPGDFHC